MPDDLSIRELKTAYLEVMMDEPGTPLSEFLDRALAHQYGVQTRDVLLAFLIDVERDTVSSIYMQIEAHPALYETVSERIEEVRASFAELRRKVEASSAPS